MILSIAMNALKMSALDASGRASAGPIRTPYMEAWIISSGSDPAAPLRRLRRALPAGPDFPEQGPQRAAGERQGLTALPQQAGWPRAPRLRIPTDRTADRTA